MTNHNALLVSMKLNQLEKGLSEHTIEKLIKLIRSDYLKAKTIEIRSTNDKEQRNKLKNELPLVFFNNQYHDRNQGASIYLPKVCHGVMVMDLDVYDPEYVAHIDKQIRTTAVWPYIMFMFKSPSGGLKFAIKTDVQEDDNEFHSIGYCKVLTLLERLGITCELDGKCKNINRGTYICHDASAYYNGDCKTLALAEKVRKSYASMKAQEAADIAFRAAEREYSDGIDFDRARNWYEKEVQKIISRTVSGFRHQNAYTVAVTAFNIGLDESDALYGLQMYKFANLYVDGMSIENKVREVKQHWQSNGSKVSNTFLKRNREQKREFLKTQFV